MRHLVGTLLLLITAPYGYAASFDCNAASTTVEKLICDSPTASNLDEEMAAHYFRNRKQDHSNTVIANQRIWLQYRNTCQSTQCLISAYQSRIATLTTPTDLKTATEPTKNPIDKSNAVSVKTKNKGTDWTVTKQQLFDGANYTACTNPGTGSNLCLKCEDSEGEKILGLIADTSETIGYVFNESAKFEVRIDNRPVVEQGGAVAGNDIAITRIQTIDSDGELHLGSFHRSDLIGQMRKGNTMAIRITTQRTSDIVASLRGFTAATKELLQACNYYHKRDLSQLTK